MINMMITVMIMIMIFREWMVSVGYLRMEFDSSNFVVY